ncbi:hypothetical protein CGMCC3_g17229 [Colletotrichum fructicola]|nr:uncharacterized protein CGMCC3_g17229 [Colletotrichum fructicola]KAE9566619.1 hypothetical protein CGMCC3_g17229 [Colletotrichum fructicola]
MDPLSIENYSFNFPNAIRRVLNSNPNNEKNKGYKAFILSAEVIKDLENGKLLDAKSLTALKRHRIESEPASPGACQDSEPVYALFKRSSGGVLR